MALLPLDLSTSPGRACDGLSSTQACVRGVLPPKRLSQRKSCTAPPPLQSWFHSAHHYQLCSFSYLPPEFS